MATPVRCVLLVFVLLVAGNARAADDGANKYLIVNCLQPPRTRPGGGLVMEIPRPPLKTTRAECDRLRGRVASAQEAWGASAAQGDNTSKLHVANEQSRGDQGVKDCRQAARSYEQVIASGARPERATALFSLAYLYETGCGVARDLERARTLYAEALGLQGQAPGPAEPRIVFGSFHALVIGNNAYLHLPKLRTAGNDAHAVAEILKTRYAFRVKLLVDATRDQILEHLESLRRELKKDDNLLIYYAGHGVFDEQNDRGYWQPVDARRDSRTHWIKTEDVTDIINTMAAYRVLIVSDSCFSGAWARSVFTDLYPKEVAYWIERLARKRARLVLTSGGLEPVPDRGDGKHSVFAKYFIEALNDNSKILVGRRLYDYLDVRVPYKSETRQEPVYAPLRLAVGHEGGEFFFQRVGEKP